MTATDLDATLRDAAARGEVLLYTPDDDGFELMRDPRESTDEEETSDD